jgi:hypothetical protein
VSSVQALADSGQWDALTAALDPVVELAADCIDAQLLLARQCLQRNDFEGCTMATGRVLKIQPSNTEALLLRASAFFKLEVSQHPFESVQLNEPEADDVLIAAAITLQLDAGLQCFQRRAS